jgi:DNA-binding transcriptional LysR family regulator
MPKASLDLNELVVFARVVDAGSFTAAAAALEMPKSTVSRKVTDLEARLGARLLQRTTRKLHLTDAGTAYYSYCARIVAEMEEAEHAVGRLQEVPRGRLRVTTPLNFAFLGPILTSFARRYPEVIFDVVSTDRVVDLVEEGFDLAIRAGPLPDSSTLVARSLGSMARIVVASARYLKKHGRPRAPGDLARHDALVFGAGANPSTWQLVAGTSTSHPGQGTGRNATATLEVAVKARLVVNDFDVLLQAARADLGVAMLPLFVGAEEIRARRLEHLLKEWSSPPARIHAVYPSTRHLSPKVKAFVEHLREQFTPPPWER